MVPPLTLDCGEGFAEAIAALPQAQAVYVIHPKEGRPHLGRTNVLRRRITRLFERWNLLQIADHVDYWLTASHLEQWQLSYTLARTYFPDEYERILRLPKPSYVRLLLANQFPRTQVTTRLSGSRGVTYGPFQSRARADQFEGAFLDLFQLRRCQEDLTPSPEHPGCIYGEMLKCLRPCQDAVTTEEYASEAGRVAEFLSHRGEKLLDATTLARDRASEDLNFEEAAAQHGRLERIQSIVKVSGDLARDINALHGVAVTRSVEPESVLLWFMREGAWAEPHQFSVALVGTKPLSLDTRLREIVAAIPSKKLTLAERQDHLALLAKWFYSSWRDGEWLAIDEWPDVAYRKLVNAIHRTVRALPSKP